MKKFILLALFAFFMGSLSLTVQAQSRDGSNGIGRPGDFATKEKGPSGWLCIPGNNGFATCLCYSDDDCEALGYVYSCSDSREGPGIRYPCTPKNE